MIESLDTIIKFSILYDTIGTCRACHSSNTPMKMGVERVLKKKFGDELKEIYQVDQQNIHATIVV